MKYVLVIIAAVFLIFAIPPFKTMWDSWIPGLIETTPDMTVFEIALLTYWPWLAVLFIIIAVFVVMKGKSGT